MLRRRIVSTTLPAIAIAAMVLAFVNCRQPGEAKSSRIRRTILLEFKAEAAPEEIRKILGEVRANIEGIEGVRNVVIGSQSIDRIPFRYGISMDFDDEAALKRYRQDDEHRRTHNDYSRLIEQAQISDIRDE
ncbi:MAG: Dabb family protein [Blastocatellales bacterium]|nr:Dabb family protein [Blastocatellales bacterium]